MRQCRSAWAAAPLLHVGELAAVGNGLAAEPRHPTPGRDPADQRLIALQRSGLHQEVRRRRRRGATPLSAVEHAAVRDLGNVRTAARHGVSNHGLHAGAIPDWRRDAPPAVCQREIRTSALHRQTHHDLLLRALLPRDEAIESFSSATPCEIGERPVQVHAIQLLELRPPGPPRDEAVRGADRGLSGHLADVYARPRGGGVPQEAATVAA
mmetsp:Transcript_55312/g.160259  ORF Transcript_55312/g.160259 Transcript_55312/m.160259 type:complete len:210 (-) Transcript_55312:23-652(-)